MPDTSTVLGYVLACGIVGMVGTLWRVSVTLARVAVRLDTLSSQLVQHDERISRVERGGA